MKIKMFLLKMSHWLCIRFASWIDQSVTTSYPAQSAYHIYNSTKEYRTELTQVTKHLQLISEKLEVEELKKSGRWSFTQKFWSSFVMHVTRSTKTLEGPYQLSYIQEMQVKHLPGVSISKYRGAVPLNIFTLESNVSILSGTAPLYLTDRTWL